MALSVSAQLKKSLGVSFADAGIKQTMFQIDEQKSEAWDYSKYLTSGINFGEYIRIDHSGEDTHFQEFEEVLSPDKQFWHIAFGPQVDPTIMDGLELELPLRRSVGEIVQNFTVGD